MKPLIGTSGFGIGRAKYVQLFPCVEVQHTFYQPPAISTLERWRETAPPDFEFVLKAWQLITHDARSPTYRRLKKKLSEVEKEEAGYFRPTAIVNEAWAVTKACARALKAKTILFQCPASFKPTNENIANLREFFSSMAGESPDVRDAFNLCWEPRGDWDPKTVKRLCSELGLCHVVDPFVNKTVTSDRVYFRLHGKGGWRYEYDEAELRELAAMLATRKQGAGSNNAAYVFFNNVRMIQDAARFQVIVKEVSSDHTD